MHHAVHADRANGILEPISEYSEDQPAPINTPEHIQDLRPADPAIHDEGAADDQDTADAEREKTKIRRSVRRCDRIGINILHYARPFPSGANRARRIVSTQVMLSHATLTFVCSAKEPGSSSEV